MIVRYRGYNPAGQEVKGTLEVDSLRVAEDRLFQADLTLVSLKKVYRLPTLQEALPTLFRVKSRDLTAFTRQMASLLEAGIALLPALKLLQQQMSNPLLKTTVGQICQDLQEGNLFSQALARHPQIFPPSYQRLVAVGEETGNLAEMLRRLAAYQEKEAALTSKVMRAVSYPVFVMIIGVIAAVFLTTFTLPAMAGLFSEYGAKLPFTTRMLMFFSEFITSYGKLLALALVVAFILGILYMRTPAGRLRRDRLLLKLPLVKTVLGLSSMARITSNMATLLSAGLPLTDTMDLLIRTTPNMAIREALVKARAEILAGRRLSSALTAQGVFPPLMTQMIGVGEETGTLASNLESIAAFFEQETDLAVNNLTAMIEPLIIIVVGIGIGFVAISVITPMYSIMKQIR